MTVPGKDLIQKNFSFNFNFYFISLYNTVLVLPYIDMNPPWVYMSSQTWTPLPPPTPYSDKQKLREFSTIKSALQQMLKGLYSQEIQEKKKIYKINPKRLRKWQ